MDPYNVINDTIKVLKAAKGDLILFGMNGMTVGLIDKAIKDNEDAIEEYENELDNFNTSKVELQYEGLIEQEKIDRYTEERLDELRKVNHNG
tara:strand:+ start:544 stop:819 length:276 start_codon:yes stop_codon:yes gene_type:complete